MVVVVFSCQVMSDSCDPMDCSLPGSSGEDTGVGCYFLLQGIFPAQESNPGLLHCRKILYRLSYGGSLSAAYEVLSLSYQ